MEEKIDCKLYTCQAKLTTFNMTRVKWNGLHIHNDISMCIHAYILSCILIDKEPNYRERRNVYHVSNCQCIDKTEVFRAVDISVLHELEVLLIDAPLDDSWHRVRKHVPSLSFLNQCLKNIGKYNKIATDNTQGSQEWYCRVICMYRYMYKSSCIW